MQELPVDEGPPVRDGAARSAQGAGMFTVRIEHAPPSELPRRSVFMCMEYTVTYEDDERVARLRMAADHVADIPREVLITNGGVAYVMNARGFTVDVIRTRKGESHGALQGEGRV